MLWHEIFGIEQNIDALFSPTHIVLALGIVLILSAPLRAAWAADPLNPAPSYRELLPVTLSLSLVTTLVAFMFMYFGAFSYAENVPTVAERQAFASSGNSSFWSLSVIAAFLVTTFFLLAPLLLAHRRWHLPFGFATTLFTLLAVLTGAIAEYALPERILAAAIAGVAVDLLGRALRPATGGRSFWIFGLVAPTALWTVDLGCSR
ncbi:MAG: hypothetical protein ACR2MA_00100 [Egibacteraceae bacterium]